MTRARRHTLIAALAALSLLAACGSEDSTSSGDTASADTEADDSRGGLYGGDEPAATEAPASEAPPTGAPPPAGGASAVTIKDFAFGPADAEVAAGSAVSWTNEDGAAHRIKSGDGSFDSEDLGQGDAFEHTFDAAGTFDYVCGIHPSMTGTITVTG